MVDGSWLMAHGSRMAGGPAGGGASHPSQPGPPANFKSHISCFFGTFSTKTKDYQGIHPWWFCRWSLIPDLLRVCAFVHRSGFRYIILFRFCSTVWVHKTTLFVVLSWLVLPPSDNCPTPSHLAYTCTHPTPKAFRVVVAVAWQDFFVWIGTPRPRGIFCCIKTPKRGVYDPSCAKLCFGYVLIYILDPNLSRRRGCLIMFNLCLIRGQWNIIYITSQWHWFPVWGFRLGAPGDASSKRPQLGASS